MLTKRSFVFVALFCLLLSLTKDMSLAQDTTDVCRNLTPENRRIAEASGIDVDVLCSGQAEVVIPSESRAPPVIETPPREPETVAPDSLSELELQPFGYDLFAGSPTTFAPAAGIPVSPNYLLGPGDVLQILFYGKTSASFELEINRDGFINFPEIGPIGLTGLTFDEAKKMLLARISEQMIGVQASISLGELRSIQIFILGEAYKPGAYTVSSLSTITNALIVSGGVSDIASLRNIQLKRADKVVATLDLYDLLLKGDISNDLRLQNIDVIFIPTVGDRVSVEGEVLRPAIYELKRNTTAQQLVELAGGLGSKAFPKSARIERINDSGFMTVIDLDLTEVKGQNLPVQQGDNLHVSSFIDRKENIVTLSGHVYRPGDFRWKAGMRISDLVSNIDQLQDKINLNFALLVRELLPTGDVQTFSVDLRSVLANPGSEADLQLSSRDVLMIFSSVDDPYPQLSDLLDVLKAQARSGELVQIVTIEGFAKYPGEYPLTSGMTMTQLIQAAGGLMEGSYALSAELARLNLNNQELAQYSHQSVSLAAASNNPSSDIQLLPHDIITIRTIPGFQATTSIILNGEFRFPGEYNFAHGELLSQVIKRAGGMTGSAHLNAAIFTRKELREREIIQLLKLQKELEQTVAEQTIQRSTEGGMKELEVAEDTMLERLGTAKPVGRLVIDLQSVLEGTIDDLNLKDGDILYVPQHNQEVAVIGEINYPTAHMYNKDLGVKDYLDRSGGMTSNADENRIYIVRADGSVLIPRSSSFFRENLIIQPGDTLVVPFDVSAMNPLTVWGEVTQVIYQLAIATAAVNSF